MYLWPLVVSDRANMRTVQIGLRALWNAESTDLGLLMAGAVIALVPTAILLFAAQRYLVRGLTAGAVKG
jgi:sn-glycerol 3-phosphate transport system permease protein